MKKILVAIAIAACASSAYATISGSTHDMRTKGGTKGACQYCHAPHLWTSPTGFTGNVAPLWNRNGPTVTTTRVGVTVSDITRACVSCHDGTTQLGAMVNNPDNSFSAVVEKGVVGTAIGDDHPVDVAFPTAGTGYQYPGAAYGITGAGNMLRCTSCHDVHNEVSGATPFYVVDIATVDICAACHTK